jgi:hypothetical protein
MARLADGRWSIWVVAWVAHALTTNPLRLYEANITSSSITHATQPIRRWTPGNDWGRLNHACVLSHEPTT